MKKWGHVLLLLLWTAPLLLYAQEQSIEYQGAYEITPEKEKARVQQIQEESKPKTEGLTRVQTEAPAVIETNSLYYYESGYSRFYQGFFVDDNTIDINGTQFRLHNWVLSFLPVKEGAFRTPRFEIQNLHLISVKMIFKEAQTEVTQCHIDFYQNQRPTPCEIPATLNPSLLTVDIEALTSEGIAYHLSMGLTQGLNETYQGSFSLKQLNAIELSHYPYRVAMISEKNWFSLIAPMNDRFQLILEFQGQQAIINIANHEPLPNYAFLPAIKEEAPTYPEGYPFHVKIYSPRKSIDLSIRIFVDAGMRYMTGKEGTGQSADIFPLAEIRLTTFAAGFPYLAGHFAFEQSLQNAISKSTLTNLSAYDLQARFQYQLKAAWSRPTVWVGAGLFEINIQDRAFAGAFLPRSSGAGILIGADANVYDNFHFRPGVYYPFLLDQVNVTSYIRPEIGIAYEFTDHLAAEAHWKGTFYSRTPTGAAARSGVMHDGGIFFRYNL